MEKELKNKIENSVQNLLNGVFSLEKTNIKRYEDRLIFSCPYCGDSATDHTKKRGWLYFNSAYYHCFNCGIHKTASTLLNNFDSNELNLDDRVFLNKVYREYQKNLLRTTELDLDIFDDVEKYSIDINQLFCRLKIRLIKESDDLWTYCKNRLITHKKHLFAVDKYQDKIYILNLLDESKVLSYQIRYLNKDIKYKTWNLSTINKYIFKRDIEVNSIESKVSWTSQIFNFYGVDFSKEFTIFEGPIDSFFMKNSIAITGATKDTSFFDQFAGVRYFFDNDTEGKKRALKKIEEGLRCFLWAKYIRENSLIDFKLKDLNDIWMLVKKTGNKQYLDLDKYFSTTSLDAIYL